MNPVFADTFYWIALTNVRDSANRRVLEFSPITTDEVLTDLEVPVIGQHFSYPFPAHGLHGNAIREAITLVWAGAIEFEASKKAGSAQRKNAYIRTGKNILNHQSGVSARPGGESTMRSNGCAADAPRAVRI